MRNKILIVFGVVLVAGLTMVLIYIFKTPTPTQNGTAEQSKDSLSYTNTISNPMSFTSNQASTKNSNVEVKLYPSTIDSSHPYSTNAIVFTSNIVGETYTTNDINPSTKVLNYDKFSIIISVGGEGNPIGLGSPIPALAILESGLPMQVKRMDYSQNDRILSLFNTYGIKFENKFIYSSNIKTNSDCGGVFEDTFCGIEYIKLPSGIPLHITCGTNDREGLAKCDEFVNNLELL